MSFNAEKETAKRITDGEKLPFNSQVPMLSPWT